MRMLKIEKISTKLLIAMVLVIALLITANYALAVRKFREAANEDLVTEAAAFTAVADEAKNHTSAIHADNSFDMKSLKAELAQAIAEGRSYRETRLFKAIPVVAGWQAALKAAEREHIDFKILAFNARNDDNSPEPGSFDEKLLRDLEAQVASGGEDYIHRDNPETNSVVYMRAIELDKSCMMCHGDPAVYDEKDEHGRSDGLDLAGFKYESWKPGDVHGAYTVTMPLQEVDARVAGFIWSGTAISIPMIVIASGLIAWFLRRILSKPVTHLVTTMREIITTHDLTRRVNIKSNNEVGQISRWFDDLVASLQEIIASVSGSSCQVAAAATQIAASSEEMSTGLSAQERQSTQVSAAVEEMSASITKVAQQSTDAAKSASESRQEASKGGEVVQRTIREIHQIADIVKASSTKMAELGAKGQKIGSIIEVINDIADQTNLLALNAAIEAARAGEQGRGFAVVADEVRRLAERTSQATEEVARSIQEIQRDTQEAIQGIELGSSSVAQGVELSNSAGNALSSIVGRSDNVAGMVQAIAATVDEQSSASSVIAKSVEEINAVARESAAGARQAAEAAQDLSRQAEILRGLVSRFKA